MKPYENKRLLKSDCVGSYGSLDKEEVMTWYLQLNSGGVVHQESELERVRQLIKEEEQKNEH